MNDPADGATRRGFLAALASGAALAGLPQAPALAEGAEARIEPFYGAHQAGVVTPAQTHAYFTAFDLTTGKRAEVAGFMRDWTECAARLTAGEAPPAVSYLHACCGQPKRAILRG